MQSEIRFLVENYYDIQKLRVEAFNRIVAYVKSHSKFENHITHAKSQIETENQVRSASHSKVETHGKSASQPTFENRVKHASRMAVEAQSGYASHLNHEAHREGASQGTIETQATCAKPSVVAYEIVKGKRETPKQISNLVWYHNSLLETEKQLAKRLDAWSQHHPLRITFLSKISGIGPILSSGILAWLTPISRFPNISKLWKYCGLAPDQKRRKGTKLNYSPRLKTLMWKIAVSFEKQNQKKSRYRRIYLEKKQYYMNRADLKKKLKSKEKGVKGHIRNMALRYTVKRFLADLWLFWRRLEGLPVTKPYSIAVLGHEGFEQPEVDKSGKGAQENHPR